MQIYKTYLSPTSFHSAYIVLKNYHLFGRSVSNNVLEKKLGRKINMQVRLDKNLLGGVVIRAGDTIIDGSIRGRLTKLADSLNI